MTLFLSNLNLTKKLNEIVNSSLNYYPTTFNIKTIRYIKDLKKVPLQITPILSSDIFLFDIFKKSTEPKKEKIIKVNQFSNNFFFSFENEIFSNKLLLESIIENQIIPDFFIEKIFNSKSFFFREKKNI